MNKKRKSFSRYTALVLIMMMVFSAILSRLAFLQIVKADEYKEKANKRAITEIQDFAPRGNIIDKNGVTLATNEQSYMLTFTETDDSKIDFFQTMNTVFSILDENGEIQKDDFQLKINPFRFEFNASDDDTRKDLEIRFKKDRGLDEDIKKKLYPKKKDKLTDDEVEKVNEELLKITPEQVFNSLIKAYGITPEDIFKNYVDIYKTSPDDALALIKAQYKVSSETEVKALLEEYKNDKKKSKDTLKTLMEKCGVDQVKFTPEQQRRYMLIKDAIKMQSFSGYKPVIIASNIKKETAFIFLQKLNDLPGIDVTIQPIRYYPYDQLGSAFLGYISKISSNQEKYEEMGYDVNTDFVGTAGIEGVYEDRLRGSKGGRIVKLNRQGRVFEELGSRESYPGQTLQLTIDSNVQYAAEVAMDNVMKDLQSKGVQKDVNTANATRGAAVAVDVNTGAILALVSRPGFDPNDFADPRGLTSDQFAKYFNPDLAAYGKSRGFDDNRIDQLFPIVDKDKGTRKDAYDFIPKPLYNYATLSLTPPGSTFKPMTAVAGLETGVVTPNTTIFDGGYFDDGHNFKTTFPADGANGTVDLVTALAKSSNPYFMTVGQKLRENYDDDILAQYAWKFGLGVKPNSGVKPSTGIEIPEAFGQVFNTWSIKNRFAQSFLAVTMDTLKEGKGFRGNTFTPIDLYYKDSDSDDLRQIKKDIKDQIQDSVKTGNRAENAYKDLFTKLTSADPDLKDKGISKTEISTIVYEIGHITVDDGNFQTKIGANMYNASIGQGISNFTPLQLANYVATMVNGGDRYKLHLVDKILDPSDNHVIQEVKPEIVEKTGIKQSTVDAIKVGMHAVVGEDGTAAGVFNGLPIDTAGKTGSATYSQKQDEIGRTSYAVYVGFAPYDKPRIAVAIVLFDGGHGSFIAPVARAMYEAYFKKELDAMNYVPVNDVTPKPIK